MIAWRVIQELRGEVAKHGLGSQEVMQTLQVTATDLLCPSDIRQLAKALLWPLQSAMFLMLWTEDSAKFAASNRLLPPEDPRHGVGVDALLGESAYCPPDSQATWDVLEQGQALGFAALVKTIEAASPFH